MTDADLDSVYSIEQVAHQHPWTRKILQDCLHAGYLCTVCLNGDEIVGFSMLTLAVGESHLLNICIAKEVQGKGVGRALLMYSLEKIRAEGAESIFLEVRPSNISAIKLYHSVGFYESGLRKGYYPGKNGREDAILMNFFLKVA